jgi:hypothetical protein
MVAAPTRQEFYRGVLLALRSHGETFHADTRMHEAFEEMLSVGYLAAEMPFSRLLEELLNEHDPIFDVYKPAEDMILEGMCSFILGLEGTALRRARFIITEAQAAKELVEIPHAAVYKELAKTFYEHAS